MQPQQPVVAARKRIRVLSRRVQLIAPIAVLMLALLFSSLVLSSRLHIGTTPPLSRSSFSVQTSSGPDLRDEHPQRQWQEMHQQTASPAVCVPVATNGRRHVPATGAGNC
jgi:hypothetical protein